MDSLFLWEIGSPRVYLIWLFVFLTQMAIAEINRRWTDRKSTRLNSSHTAASRMPSSA